MGIQMSILLWTSPMTGSEFSHVGLIQICAETIPMDQLDSSQFQNTIMGTGQTLQNVSMFRDAVYWMSLTGKFSYYF